MTTAVNTTTPIPPAHRVSLPAAILALVGLIAACLAVGILGAVWTADSVRTWYVLIRKPSWTPPNWVFGPVWTGLYVMMAVAAWLVWKRAGLRDGKAPLLLFGLQLALNLAWSNIFFGMRRPDLAFLDIAALWLAIVATIVAFRRISWPAALLLVPYLLWVSYASALNLAIWRLNA